MATIEELPEDYQEQPQVEEVSGSNSTGQANGNTQEGQGGATNSSLNNSMNQSFNNTDSDSNAPLSSRGSTKATGQEDSMTVRSVDDDRVNGDYIESRGYRHRHNYYGEEEEDMKDIDGSPMMTNRFFWELFKKEWKKYYRTPSLNEKLYLHFKGFSYIRNMEQFTGLKCLYFEGNGCKSLKGLEHCVQMRSLFMQENMIKVMEGLDTMSELRQLNLSENMIEKIEGIEKNTLLDTIHLKRNRIGRCKEGSVEACRGLLSRPSLHCVDLQDNYIEEQEIVEEIFVKMPNLKVLYLMNNPFIKKMSGYRKTVIAKIPTLTYLDDRPVFDDDRRRAEAWFRGGIEEERLEIKKIKKEKDDKHWANHEAFRFMVNKAKDEKKSEDAQNKEAKDYKKKSMKEMMAAAKVAKEQGRGAETGQYSVKEINAANGEFVWEPNDLQKNTEFYNGVQEKSKQRFDEKTKGVEHEDDLGEELTKPASQDVIDANKLFEKKENIEMDAEFQAFKTTVTDKDTADLLQKEYDQNKVEHDKNKGIKIEEVKTIESEAQDNEEEEEDIPGLEDVNLEELDRSKEQKKKEWLNKIVNEQQASQKEQQKNIKEKVPLENQEQKAPVDQVKLTKSERRKQNKQKNKKKGKIIQEVEESDSQKMVELEDILLDEKKTTEIFNKIVKKDIKENIEQQMEAAVESKDTDFDELD